MNRKILFLFPLLIALLTMGCILTSAPASPTLPPDATVPVVESTWTDIPAEPTLQVTETSAVEPTQAPTTASTADPLASCPVPTETATLYASRENGYCFLVPAGFRVDPDGQRPEESILLVGPSESGDGMERATVIIQVANNGPADGLTTETYGVKWHERFVGAEAALNIAPGTMGGQPAMILRDIPGMIGGQGAFLIVNGIKYQVMTSPQPGSVPELTDVTNQALEIVRSSIVFFPPENDRVYRTSAMACPAAGTDTKLIINEANGYCFLYPASFEINDMFSTFDWIIGGPVLGSVEGFENVRTSLSPGAYGAFPGKTPRDMLAMRTTDTYDVASVTDITIGGYPAVAWRDLNGPWASRQAFIGVNGMFYTIVAQPWEPERWPDGIPYLDLAWNTVTGTMQFFTPWR